MEKENENNKKNKLTILDKIKIKGLLFFLKLTGSKKDYISFKKRLNDALDVSTSVGAESFGLYGLPDVEYDNIYNQLKINDKYKYIRINNISGGIIYEGGGKIYIHNNLKGNIYAPNSCIYIRKSLYGFIEAENSKILIRESNYGYIHCPNGEVLIGGSNYGFINTSKGKFTILEKDSGITKGNEKILTYEQKELLLGTKKTL